MKALAVALWLILAGPVWAQTADQKPSDQKSEQKQQAAPAAPDAPSAEAPRIDPTKEADIRRLLEASGGPGNAMQVMKRMEDGIKPMLSNSLPPGEYRDKLIELFLERFRSKFNAQQIEDLAVPVYDKYFSDDEIKQLMAFYATPLGKKSLTVMPQLLGELQDKGQQLGSKLGRESMIEVLREHPDLAQALEDAAKAKQPQ